MRNVLTITMIAGLGVSLLGCGKSDPAATKLCNDYVAATCERFFTCGADDIAAASGGDTSGSDCTPKQPGKPGYFPASFACYQSASDCTAREQRKACTDVASTRCDDGETYHANKAQDCVSAWQALTCDEIKNFSQQPIVCAQICTLPNAGPPPQ
jgi:hypothetical protein